MFDVRCLIHSEPGDGHINEDVVAVRPHPGNADVVLCALADGQGGQAGGAADDAVREDDAAGYCSLVSLCLSGQGVWGASCGDGGALLLSGGRDILLTDDQRKNPPVGSGVSCPVAFSARLAPGWVLLVVSDGVWKYVGWDQITRMAARHQGPELITALRQAALDASGGSLPDDFSVALLYDGGTQMEQNGS